MPSEDPAQRLDDIIDNIRRIRTYIEGMDEGMFISNFSKPNLALGPKK